MTIDIQTRPLASDFFGPGQNAISSGWGQQPRDALHVLLLTSITNADCRNRVPTEYEHAVYDHTLCMLPAPETAICDWGNPLVANAFIVGINAWDAACDGTLPAAHERISHFRDWILTHITL